MRATITRKGRCAEDGYTEPYALLADGRTMPMGWNRFGEIYEVGTRGTAEYIAGLWRFTADATVRCEVGRCTDDATVYGGRTGSFDWEGAACEHHAGALDWTQPLPGREPDQLYTFAYGMNMAPGMMGPKEAGIAATLHGYALEYRDFADVVPSEGGSVPGVLWRITPRMLGNLDFREGYPHLYGRDLVDIETATGTVKAWVYRMTDRTRSNYLAEGIGTNRYRETMIEGREAFGFPTDDIPEVGMKIRARH